jgi:H-type small acid-soluble spore protein
MRPERAVEIINSQTLTLVTHNDKAIWINKVNPDRLTAEVKDLTTNRTTDVSLSELKEL